MTTDLSAVVQGAARRRWQSSVKLRLAVVMALAVAALCLVLGLSALESARASGLASAVNQVGALRMQTWVIASALLDQGPQERGRSAAIIAAVGEFDRRVADPQLWRALAANHDSRHRQAVEQLREDWSTTIRALALEASDFPAVRENYVRQAPLFTARIDAAVRLIETDLQAHVSWALRYLVLAFVVLLLGVAVAVVMLRRQVLTPMADLLDVTRRLRAGDGTARAVAVRDDEFGQLAAGFNSLIAQMARFADALEHQVQAKTVDLARRNQSLSLLYLATRRLSDNPLDERGLHEVLTALAGALGRRDLAGCTLRLQGLAVRGVAGTDALLVTTATDSPAVHPATREVSESFAVADANTAFGTLDVALRSRETQPGRLEPWQRELADTLARQIGAGLSTALAREEHRRLSVLEERSVIARELHDSLAQTLAFARIQIVRLAALMEANRAADAAPLPARAVLDELREGVTAAHRQLRELLTHFRIGVGDNGFAAALRGALSDFVRRTGLRANLNDTLHADDLDVSQHANVLAIVREALSNIERHARATTVEVTLLRSARSASPGATAPWAEISIDDDGVGIESLESPAGHFGLGIMRDRARVLGGSLTVSRRPAGGTRVFLSVPLSGHARRQDEDRSGPATAAQSHSVATAPVVTPQRT